MMCLNEDFRLSRHVPMSHPAPFCLTAKHLADQFVIDSVGRVRRRHALLEHQHVTRLSQDYHNPQIVRRVPPGEKNSFAPDAVITSFEPNPVRAELMAS